MIEKLYIDGFRHFKNFTLTMHDTMVLCGANGTGKSTIIEIADKIRNFVINREAIETVCSIHDIPRWEQKNKTGVFFSTIGLCYCSSSGKNYEYTLKIAHNLLAKKSAVEEESLFINSQRIYYTDVSKTVVFTDYGIEDPSSSNSKQIELPKDSKFSGLSLASKVNLGIESFLDALEYKIYPLSIKPNTIEAFQSANTTILKTDGSNFTAWYETILQTSSAKLAAVYEEYKNFIPGFIQLSFKSESGSKELTVDILRGKESYKLSINDLSDGQKILCILHLLVRVAPENSTILIDEFENFLSPLELQPLYDAAQEALEKNAIQCIFVSHHHKTLNWFQDAAVIFSFSGIPPFVKTVQYDNSSGIDIIDVLQEESGEAL